MSPKGTDPQKSRIRMAIMTKPGLPNKTWYCFTKHNKYSDAAIIAKMKKNFEKTALVNITQVLIFYDNTNGSILEKHLS